MRLLCAGILLTAAAMLQAQNTKTTVDKVNGMVTLDTDVDYIVNNTTPFADDGVVNITNTDNAVLILKNVKPSVAIPMLAAHVQINGAKAVNNTNCQVKLYNRGAIILPYGNTFKPLTVYSEQNFQGEAVNDFGLENSGGFMNTLTDAKLNNRIRSFKLKRGYMVTFSTRASGRGYSRCFIAADKDIEFATLPTVLDQRISSYRIFKWYDTGKPQLAAAGGDKNACSALNVTSTYTWGGTSDMAPDVENVPHHIYENYPSPASLGQCTTSPHMKTNNEPMNTADDPKGQVETVDQVLANWEDLMRTGMRLCSPSSWDGSDWTNGQGYIKNFIDSIDARGWRCDIIDLHCYWPEGNFGTIRNWTNSTGRPVWISEWVWGASWNSNGAFANGVTESQNAAALKRICPVLNNNDCIERYYYWNSERDPSRIYKNGKLTEAGEYYATIDGGLGYNGKYDKVPTNPRQYAPYNLTATISGGQVEIAWYDKNGEYNQLMDIQRKLPGSNDWVSLDTIEVREDAARYTYTDATPVDGAIYRAHVTDLVGINRYSNEYMVNLPYGDATMEYGRLALYDVATARETGFNERMEAAPTIIMGLMTFNNSNTITAPFFNASAISFSKFSYKGLPWKNQKNSTDTYEKAEEISYMAIVPGNYTFGDMDVEVNTINVTAPRTQPVTEVTFTKPFPEGVTPVVIGTVNRTSDSNRALMHKIWDVTNTGFKCTVMYEQSETAQPAASRLGYIAMTPGKAVIDEETGLTLAANLCDNEVYGAAKLATFAVGTDTIKAVSPYIFADMQTNNTPVPAVLRQNSVTTKTELDENNNRVVKTTGVRIRRIVDTSVNSTTSQVDSKNQADIVGWAILYNDDMTEADGIGNLWMQNGNGAALRVRTDGRVIRVDGVKDFEVFTANGTRVASNGVQAPGVYLVRADGKVSKVVVK